ncbi:alpha/beta fold hydrolase [Roseivivax sp. CAU 1761]
MLNTIVHGDPGAAPPLILAHGLYGQARNWTTIARALSGPRQVIAADLRNHGASPFTETHAYPDLAADLAELIAHHGGTADLLGHSMGGKAAMAAALLHPGAVRRLIVADIAPVAYDHDQTRFIHAMRGVDLSRVQKRSDAQRQLARVIDDPVLPAFFTQALDVAEKRWTLNLDTLEREMPRILAWPGIAGRFDGPALFLTGADSDYVRPEHRDTIRALFPRARFARIPGAGHWLHAEKPEAVARTAAAFLEARADD